MGKSLEIILWKLIDWVDNPHIRFCLYVWSFLSHSRIFPSYGNVTIADEGLQIWPMLGTHMAIELWGFLSVPHLLWHRASIYNGHIRGPVTLTPIAKHLELSLPVYDLVLSRLGFEHPTFRLLGECSYPLRHCSGPHIKQNNNHYMCNKTNYSLGISWAFQIKTLKFKIQRRLYVCQSVLLL